MPRSAAEPSGSSPVYNCQATGDPVPTIRWSKTGSGQPSIEQLKNDSLRIKNIQKADEGRYTCSASNGVKTITKEITISVYSKFFVMLIEPKKVFYRYKRSHRLNVWIKFDFDVVPKSNDRARLRSYRNSTRGIVHARTEFWMWNRNHLHSSSAFSSRIYSQNFALARIIPPAMQQRQGKCYGKTGSRYFNQNYFAVVPICLVCLM